MSQNFDLGPSLYFMLKNGKLFLYFLQPNFLDFEL